MTTRMKRRICGWIAAISAFLMLGYAGGLECGTMPLTRGVIAMVVCLAVSAAAAYKGGYLK